MALKVLSCYTLADKDMAVKLKEHLSPLVNNGLISLWDNDNIIPGTELKQEVDKHLDEAQIILLLITSSFLASEYCYNVEVQRAIERHERKETWVIPVLLQPSLWRMPPLDKLTTPLPDNTKPVALWSNRQQGFENVAQGILKVVEQWNTHSLADPTEERRALIANLDQLIETIKLQMQPSIRGIRTAETLQELSIFTPSRARLADLVVGWRILSHPFNQNENPDVKQRRVTCGELAAMASQFTQEQGNLAQAIETWQSWQEAFKNSNNPALKNDKRQNSMAQTFKRELEELQKAVVN